MATEEMKVNLIEFYSTLQRIKQSIKEPNGVLEYEIKTLAAKLSALGVNIENLNL